MRSPKCQNIVGGGGGGAVKTTNQIAGNSLFSSETILILNITQYKL